MDNQEFRRRTEIVQGQFDDLEAFRAFDQEVRSDERVQEMAARIKELRVARRAEEEKELVSRNLDLVDEIRHEKLAERGIQLDIGKVEEENERQRQEKVQAIHDQLTGEESDTELLRMFSLTDENNEFSDESMKSPLFKERTKMAFEAYRATVTTFQALVDYNQMTGVPSKNVGRADQIRGEAHNAVAREVAEDLDLEFDVARRLVAKIRDGIEPGSGEKDAYARSIRRVGRRLEKHYGADIAVAVEDQAKSILPQTVKKDDPFGL